MPNSQRFCCCPPSVRGLGVQEDIALARIWLIEPVDICSSCLMREECPDQARCLHLVASAGRPVHAQEDGSRLHFCVTGFLATCRMEARMERGPSSSR